MKIIKRILLIVLILISIVAIAGIIFLNNLKTAAIPDYNKDVAVKGLSSEVTVIRDKYAIPHIYASNENDMYTAVGFVMAQDRLWQIDLLRRVTQGRLSEIFGSQMVKTDHLMRALRIQEKSEKIIKTSSPEVISALEAYAKGVNQYIQDYPLPPEFKILGYKPEPWKPVHSINLIGYMSWDLTSGWPIEILLNKVAAEVSSGQLAELTPDMDKHKTIIFPDLRSKGINLDETLLSASAKLEELGVEIFNGSNNWAVSGERSETGKPLLANDMHLGLFTPGIWYQIHQVTRGKVNVTGLALPGQPFIIAGHNDSIAWGMTNVAVDDLDFYYETINSDSTKYLFNNKWKDLIVSEEKIQVKGGESVKKRILFTHRGPLVNTFINADEKPVSIHWIGNEMSNEIRSVFKLNRAKNWDEFLDAVKSFKSVSQNIVYADMAGNIGLQTCAGVPIRKGCGIQVYPGETDEFDWQGLVPFEQLPFEFNPERGYVSSANNKTAPNDYPYYISHWYATPDRINGIRDMLDSKEKFQVADFQKLHANFQSKLVERILPHFLQALEKHQKMDDIEKNAFLKLSKWDGNVLKESQAVSIFEVMYRKFMQNLIKDDLSAETYMDLKNSRMLLENLVMNILPEKKSGWIDDKTTRKIESFDDIVIRSFRESVAELSALLGNEVEGWQWGNIHTFMLEHPMGSVKILDKAFSLNRGPYQMPGSFHTVCPYSYSYSNPFKVKHGASHRHIFDLSNWDSSLTVIPTGASGIPSSNFYCDQTKLYINNQYHADLFSAKSINKRKVFEMKLIPEK